MSSTSASAASFPTPSSSHVVHAPVAAASASGHQREGVVSFLRRVLANKTTLPESYVAIIQEFLQRIQQLETRVGRHSRFDHEYQELCVSIDHAPWYATALTPQTKHTLAKNRYRDVLPFEKTRVKLSNPLNTVAGDYINANVVGETYIACCAPVPPAIRDFWRMVWESEVVVVLMLTNFVERERIKADLYWDARGHVVDFDGVFAQLIGEEQPQLRAHGGDFIVRKFHVWTKQTESTPRLVLHVQLTTWPDHGVLRDFRVIAPMLELVNGFCQSASLLLPQQHRGKIIVHCSAGIGRSGTFIAIDVILKGLHAAFVAAGSGNGESLLRQALDVRGTVHRLRSQRPGMVQTPEQYEMIYRYVAAVLTNRQPW